MATYNIIPTSGVTEDYIKVNLEKYENECLFYGAGKGTGYTEEYRVIKNYFNKKRDNYISIKSN